MILELFLIFFEIGLFSFGGGYGMLPLMQQKTVGNGWISDAEFLDFVAIAESTPGPIAVNMATFIGASQAGIGGAIVATLGVILPSIIIILLIVAMFKNFLRYRGVKGALSGIKPVVVGLILVTGVWFALKNFFPNIASGSAEGFSIVSLIITAVLAAVVVGYKKIFKKNFSPILLILIAAGVGMIVF